MSKTPTHESDDLTEPAPQAARLAPRLAKMAERGIYVGTSSWKYEGWLGSIYSPDRYLTRGKHSKKKFEDTCLAEYAETFSTVCGDLTFYQLPSADYWLRLFEPTPPDFLFGFKVPEHITVETWPKHARYGKVAGQANESFLDIDLFTRLFLKRLEPYAGQVGPLIFEFGTFNKATFPTPQDFYARLGSFLSSLPKGWRYAVEIRNAEYLTPGYCELLSERNVAHTFNGWTRMPRLIEQVTIPETFTADFTVARALLVKGR